MVAQQNVSVNRAAETSFVTTQKLKVIAFVVIVPEEPLTVITPDSQVVNRALKLGPKGAGHKNLRSEVRSQRSEVRDQKSEVRSRNQRLEIRKGWGLLIMLPSILPTC